MGMIIMNGKEYTSSPKDGFPPIIYSDEEREVGVWRDGKPLYQKTIIRDSIGAGISVLWEGTDIDTVCNCECIFKDSYGLEYLLNYYYNNTENIRIIIDNSAVWSVGKGVCVQVGSGQAVSSIRLTVWYTKSTDTPGSGKYTTYGGLAHHYSTTEHVVGTWVDGKPLYEKTWIETIPNSRGWVIYTDNLVPDMDKVVSTEYSIDGKGQTGEAPWDTNVSVYFNIVKSTAIEFYFSGTYNAGKELIITARYTKTTD